MVDSRSRTVHVPLILLRIPDPTGGPPAVPCPGCGGPMDLHQPDGETPERLLGTCDDCRHWAVVDFVAGGGAMVMALPSTASLAGIVQDFG